MKEKHPTVLLLCVGSDALSAVSLPFFIAARSARSLLDPQRCWHLKIRLLLKVLLKVFVFGKYVFHSLVHHFISRNIEESRIAVNHFCG